MNKMKQFGQQFIDFVDASPTPFHVCHSASKLLEAAGFIKLQENVPWHGSVKAGGKYYFLRNGSSIVAFAVGGKYVAGNPFKIVGAHTDSPVLRVKPVSKQTNYGVEQVGVECYGGGLWHTWFDRDLGIAGRVIVYSGKQKFKQELVHIKDAILRVPNLCIHLQTGDEREAFKFNKEDHLKPILSVASEALNEKEDDKDLDKRHSTTLLKRLATEIGCNPADIMDFELSLCDTQPPAFGGANGEFIFSPRLDNQLHCFTSMKALIEYSGKGSSLANDEGVNMAVLFDHEEVGSDSNEGAGSPLLRDSIHRLTSCFYAYEKDAGSAIGDVLLDEVVRVGLLKSMLFSADAAHAIHPNYAGKHERNHQPKMEEGTVIKTNQNQRYATNAITGFFIRELCRRNTIACEEGKTENIKCQEFVVRNDCPCGSTIGPIIAHNVGLRVVDIGIPQLSMHSIREQCATKDIYSNYHLLQAFYAQGIEVDRSLTQL